MIELIDIGVNLTHKSLMQDLDAILQRAHDAGVSQMVVTGTSLEESLKAIELCRQYPERLVSTCGIHPHHASDWDDSYREKLESLALQDSVRAIGETGLDFNRNYSPQETQETVFSEQMALAARLGLPLFCHQRDAHEKFIALLREMRDELGPVVVHCFTDSRNALCDYLDLDCHIGITGWICDERRGLELQQLVGLIPDNRLMLETDAPYLLPRDLKPRPESRTNEPAHLAHILSAVARHRNQSEQELGRRVAANSRQFFSL